MFLVLPFFFLCVVFLCVACSVLREGTQGGRLLFLIVPLLFSLLPDKSGRREKRECEREGRGRGGKKKKLSTFVDLISDNERLAFENAMREKKETGAKGGNTEEEREGNLNSIFLKQRSRFPTPPPRRLPPLSTSTTRRRSAGPRGRSPRGPRSWRMPLSLLEFFFLKEREKCVSFLLFFFLSLFLLISPFPLSFAPSCSSSLSR